MFERQAFARDRRAEVYRKTDRNTIPDFKYALRPIEFCTGWTEHCLSIDSIKSVRGFSAICRRLPFGHRARRGRARTCQKKKMPCLRATRLDGASVVSRQLCLFSSLLLCSLCLVLAFFFFFPGDFFFFLVRAIDVRDFFLFSLGGEKGCHSLAKTLSCAMISCPDFSQSERATAYP